LAIKIQKMKLTQEKLPIPKSNGPQKAIHGEIGHRKSQSIQSGQNSKFTCFLFC